MFGGFVPEHAAAARQRAGRQRRAGGLPHLRHAPPRSRAGAARPDRRQRRASVVAGAVRRGQVARSGARLHRVQQRAGRLRGHQRPHRAGHRRAVVARHGARAARTAAPPRRGAGPRGGRQHGRHAGLCLAEHLPRPGDESSDHRRSGAALALGHRAEHGGPQRHSGGPRRRGTASRPPDRHAELPQSAELRPDPGRAEFTPGRTGGHQHLPRIPGPETGRPLL